MTIKQATIADLPKIQLCAADFYASSKFLKTFDLARFTELWTAIIENDTGAIFVFEDENGQWAGMIGGISHRDLYSEEEIASEMFWHVREGHRGQGIRLYRAFEQWALGRGCSQIRMIHLADVMPDKVANFYRRVGFTPIETHYSKELV